ncbi:hypothetical protein NDU88_004901 [Pleurodeles waltl]|uniref:RNase H type-1 domain-containing protein n=1 Tax=Pleurodeles waltl TaxID=8319 RepID=A0AAV7VKF7_PLEWA|nr:hypothetical protein NDU88_004901 [Pleurodeles waltl]
MVIPIKGEPQPQPQYPIKYEARASNSPGLFSARVAEILHELDPEALSYVDDIYLTDDELLQHLSVIFLGYELSNEGIKPLYELIRPDFSSRIWTIEHTHTLRDLQTDLLAAKHLHIRDNKTHLVIRVVAGAVGFTYVTFNEEKILTAVQMAVIKEQHHAQGKRIIVVSPTPALEAVTKASVPNAKALHPRWIQWATSLTATDVDYIFDPKLQTQEFLQYEIEYPVPAGTLPIDQYQVVMYTDGSAQPAVGTKHQYSAACAVVSGHMEGEKFCPQHTYTQTLGDCTAQLAELKALLLALEHTDPAQYTLLVCDSYYCVQSFNEYLHYWGLNGFRDSKGNTIKHRLLWGKVADLNETLPKVHVVHTLGHQRVGIHVA